MSESSRSTQWGASLWGSGVRLQPPRMWHVTGRIPTAALAPFVLTRQGNGSVLLLAPWPQMLPVLGEEDCDRGRGENRRKQTHPSSVLKIAADERKSRMERWEGPSKISFLWNRPLTCSQLKDITPRSSHPKMVDG